MTLSRQVFSKHKRLLGNKYKDRKTSHFPHEAAPVLFKSTTSIKLSLLRLPFGLLQGSADLIE